MTNQMKDFIVELIKYNLNNASVVYESVNVIGKVLTITLPSSKSFSMPFSNIDQEFFNSADDLVADIIQADFQENFNN